MPEQSKPATGYMQIAAHYRDLIRRGELADGDKLPPVRQLLQEWGVSHVTAARVLSTLRAEGLVRTVPGIGGGTIVTSQQVGHAPHDRLESGRRWGRIYPAGEHARIINAALTGAPAPVADALGIDEGTPLIRRRRITFAGDTPVSASTSWFSADLADPAPLLLAPERIVQGTPRYIEEQTGRRATHGRDQFDAALATADIAADLQILEGAPVLVGRNWFRDAAGEVIEFGEYAAVSGRWQTYEYTLD